MNESEINTLLINGSDVISDLLAFASESPDVVVPFESYLVSVNADGAPTINVK